MSTGFLAPPETTAEAQALFDGDLDELGFVMNVSRLWAYHPGTKTRLFELLRDTTAAAGLSFRERGILILACASTLGDSHCSIAWGTKLAEAANAATASLVLAGDDAALTDSEQALARWARKVARHPSATTEADVQELRDAGYSDATSSPSPCSPPCAPRSRSSTTLWAPARTPSIGRSRRRPCSTRSPTAGRWTTSLRPFDALSDHRRRH